jgi:thioredoxin-related protein
MEAGTFPNKELQEYLERHFVPVKYVSGPDAEQFTRFNVFIEPAFLVLDADGNEVYRKIGFFEADLLIEQLDKARKKAAHRAARKNILL